MIVKHVPLATHLGHHLHIQATTGQAGASLHSWLSSRACSGSALSEVRALTCFNMVQAAGSPYLAEKSSYSCQILAGHMLLHLLLSTCNRSVTRDMSQTQLPLNLCWW